MIEKKRIDEAKANVRQYLGEGLMKKVPAPDEEIKQVFIKNARESLRVAELLFKGNHSDLWAIVCSYYAMYYIANAVIYSMGHKIGGRISHKITADALIAFVREKLEDSLIAEYESAKEEALDIAMANADEIIISFDMERVKRGKIQYSTTEQVKHSRAETSLRRAERFLLEMGKIAI